MTIPSITPLPTAPARTDPPATFVTRADSFLAAMVTMQGELNTTITAMNAASANIDADVLLAQDWATKDDAAVSGTDWSAFANASGNAPTGSAKDWASEDEDIPVITGEYSAKHYSAKAATSASNASTSETNAANSETAAATSEANAAISEANAANTYDQFDDRYLGAFATDPTTDNDGDPLVIGAQYFNTTSNATKVYNGSAWQDSAPIATSVTVSQISDLTATAAEINVLDGITATTTELNYVDGVTSDVQTQLDSKAVYPDQTGNSGKYLSTDGTSTSWQQLETGVPYATVFKFQF